MENELNDEFSQSLIAREMESEQIGDYPYIEKNIKITYDLNQQIQLAHNIMERVCRTLTNEDRKIYDNQLENLNQIKFDADWLLKQIKEVEEIDEFNNKE